MTGLRRQLQDTIWSDVLQERAAQVRQFGEQRHDPAYWMAIMLKQVGQAATEVLNLKWARDPIGRVTVRTRLYRETVQILAVGLALAEAIQADELVDEITTAVPKDPRTRAEALGVGDEQINYEKDEAQA